ncbi:MAG: DUF262 domain-containing protein [Muribaculaceae bacterium]|nr:DUF262 domain-containing protein [Muribaculaceae bacterium]
MDNNYKLLKDIVGFSYVIGSYQRGYRWDEVNVRELLEDIYENKLIEDYSFSKSDFMDENEVITELTKHIRDTEYCLQPLVLKKNGNSYSVIDGQQRLTTLYIILKALCSVSDKKFPDKFSIEYRSRNKSKEFLQNLSDISESSNIDAAYILQAYKCAKKWFIAQNKSFIALLDENFVECDESKLVSAYATYLYRTLLVKTKFIWDEIDESSADMNKKEQKIFADRNTGRLELTDSELIKSLFMNPEYYGKGGVNVKDRQTLISELWDIYENELHNDELWNFLPISDENREEYSLLTRMDAIFLLLTKKNKIERNPYEENSLFKAVKHWIDKGMSVSKVCDSKYDEAASKVMISSWREVCDLFDGMKELYGSNEIYNLLSLLKMIEGDLDKILDKYLEVLGTAKNKRIDLVKKAICDVLFSKGVSITVKNVRFPERDLIRKILVAHNVAIMNSSNPINRFGFHFFDEIKGKWDIEHIYSTNEGYIAKAPIEEKVKLLHIFSERKNNTYMKYIEALYGKNIEELQGEMEDKDFSDQCFKNSRNRYDMYFDIWRYVKLREYTRELLFKYNISDKIAVILESEHFDTDANDFLHNEEYDDQEVCMLFRSEYLYWDQNIDAEYCRHKQNGTDTILWHGTEIKITDPAVFWSDDIEEKNVKSNFIRNYYRELLSIVYDNTGISAQDISFSNHGKKKDVIVDDTNREKIRAFLRGTKERIEEKIHLFFRKDESINPENNVLGVQTDYTTFASFINDNSMGNMMLLPVEINRAGKYRDVNFSGKRKYVVDKGNVFLPVATSNVLMGKYIDLESSTEQWLMNERKEYLNDMVLTMSEYYGKE